MYVMSNIVYVKIRTKGVTMYLVTENRLIYQSHGRIHYTDNMSDTAQMKKSTLSAVGNQSVLDPKLWPADVNYCAYFSEGDLWLENLAKGRMSAKAIFGSKLPLEVK